MFRHRLALVLPSFGFSSSPPAPSSVGTGLCTKPSGTNTDSAFKLMSHPNIMDQSLCALLFSFSTGVTVPSTSLPFSLSSSPNWCFMLSWLSVSLAGASGERDETKFANLLIDFSVNCVIPFLNLASGLLHFSLSLPFVSVGGS